MIAMTVAFGGPKNFVNRVGHTNLGINVHVFNVKLML